MDDKWFDEIIAACKRIIELAEEAKKHTGDSAEAQMYRSGYMLQIVQRLAALGQFIQCEAARLQMRR